MEHGNNGQDAKQNNGETLPPNIKALSDDIGIQHVTCKGCSAFASCCDSSGATGYRLGECLVFSCDACSARAWAYCRTCKKRFLHGNTNDHVKSQGHKKKQKIAYGQPASVPKEESGLGDDEALPAPTNQDDTTTSTTTMDEDYKESATLADTLISTKPISDVSQYPRLSIKGNEWMAAEFVDTGRATLSEMKAVFEGQSASMREYWFAEHATPPGYCGGGLRYYVAKTFQNAEGFQFDSSRIPKFAEAKWQFENFVQYQSMNDKQRKRQSRITEAIMDHVQQQTGKFFEQTYIPPYKDLGRLYGRTGKLSMWNTLPIPQPQNVFGVSYTTPESIIKYAFANGVPVDDIMVEAVGAPEFEFQSEDEDRKVYHVGECRKATKWLDGLATSSTHKKSLACWLADWKDGFGPSRVKNNRGSVDAWTFTIAPPKHLINATENTFLLALGPKNAHEGWEAVGHMFRKDMKRLIDGGPLMVYSGAIQKVIPVNLKRLVALTDKQERPESSATIGPGSNIHRCFGVAGAIETPSCKVEEVKEFLAAERLGQTDGRYGWCDEFVIGNDRNGKAFATCKKCRKKRLQRMGVIPIRKNQTAEKQDCACADWVQWEPAGEQKECLKFTASNDYPTFTAAGCPIEPPKGRETGLTQLCQVKLTWDLMIRACRFAFYNCSRPKAKGVKNWNQANCFEYGRTCGISSKIMRALNDAAKEARTNNAGVNYNDQESIGSFKFPWAWLGDISVSDYIETIMHLMHLGITESNLELATKWLKKTKTSGLDSTKFRRGVNELLEELKKLQLAWLLVFPFTGTDFKTGAWVSENWLAFARISPIIFGWLLPPPGDEDCPVDCLDLVRVVLSYHCVAARVHTHGGVNQAFVDETENYMKEFLSSVRELDVRVRHNKLNTVSKKKGETKKKEAFWLKSNYMSLLNLLNMMVELGPLVLWWDGGGKGERFIQEIKPHILRGVRADIKDFWVNLHTKIYKVRQLKYMEQRYGLEGLLDGLVDESEEDGGLVSLAEAIAFDDIEGEDPETSSVEDYMSSDSDDDSEDDSVDKDTAKSHLQFSQVEEDGMHKQKTIYVYRNTGLLEAAIEQGKPIAGCVQLEDRPSKSGGVKEKKLVFYTVHRVPVKSFARRELEFLDDDGIHHHGMWYCGVNPHKENVQTTDSFVDIQNDSKMAAVAIPLRYIIRLDKGEEVPEDLRNKYCVVTNYWKVRDGTGTYDLPCLDPSLYNFKRKAPSTNEVGTI